MLHCLFDLIYKSMLLRILKRLFWWGRTIDTKTCTKLTCFIVKAEKWSYKEQVVQYDKIYHHILKELWYTGTFGEILRREPKEIKNIQEVWELHKLRNSLVHELKERDEKLMKQQAGKYKMVCETFIKQVTVK